VALVDPAFLLQRQLAEHIPEMLSQFSVEHLPAVLGNEHHRYLHSHLGCLRLSKSSIVKLPLVCLAADVASAVVVSRVSGSIRCSVVDPAALGVM
jgi:hypothetical protein